MATYKRKKLKNEPDTCYEAKIKKLEVDFNLAVGGQIFTHMEGGCSQPLVI